AAVVGLAQALVTQEGLAATERCRQRLERLAQPPRERRVVAVAEREPLFGRAAQRAHPPGRAPGERRRRLAAAQSLHALVDRARKAVDGSAPRPPGRPAHAARRPPATARALRSTAGSRRPRRRARARRPVPPARGVACWRTAASRSA